MIVDLGIGADVSLAGGKARGLQRLLAAGLPCPPAFCVTTAALDAYLDEGGLRERAASRIGTPTPPREGISTPRGVLEQVAPEVPSTPAGIRACPHDLRALAFEADLPVAFEAERAAAVARLRDRAPGVDLAPGLPGSQAPALLLEHRGVAPAIPGDVLRRQGSNGKAKN